MISPARINQGFPGFPMRGNTPAFPDFRRMSAIGKVLWTPAEITTALWLDAADSDSLTLDGSDNVEQWNDKSGNDKHATQISSSVRPSFESSPNRIEFSNGPYLILPEYHQASGVTGFIVGRVDSSISSILGSATNVGGMGNDLWKYFYESTSVRLKVENNVLHLAGVVVVENDYFIGTFYIDPGVVVGNSINGSSVVTSSLETNYLLSDSVNYIGYDSITSRRLDGGLSEIIIVSSVMSIEDRQKIEGYLAHKWGLEANLPSDHPYKTKAPYK
jgi:hypothetical protein